jgi:predicted nucleotidyltransferase component of viral defense system
VVDSQDIGLAGGGALISQGLVDRLTRDLDFFATPGVLLSEFAPQIIEALVKEGFEVEIKREAETFYRLAIKNLDDETELDLAIDGRLFPLIDSDIGKALSPLELATEKVLAIFGRAEPRDFLDLATLVETFDLRELFDLARKKDPGFTPEVFAAMSHRIEVLPRQVFGLDDKAYTALLARVRVTKWQELTRGPIKSIEVTPERSHDHGLEP